MALTLDLLPGELLEIGHCVTVQVVRKAGRMARLEVRAPPGIPIVRRPPQTGREPLAVFVPTMRQSGCSQAGK
ncbi:MAG: carbon storage regulator [Burkholderiaceae bacterium]|jgi:hypothetical protein|nr:carbon storage regulator [Burkholderiaceae bacterium]